MPENTRLKELKRQLQEKSAAFQSSSRSAFLPDFLSAKIRIQPLR
jgi:hypothetical protein